MNNKWFLHARYFLTWIFFFIGAKAFFLLYHFSRSSKLSGTEVSKIFIYGLRMDISFAGYLSIIPFLLLLVKAFFPQLNILKPIKYYTWFFIVLIALLTTVDLELYNAWGFRLDATPLQYLATPTEMAASSGNAPVLLLVGLFLLLSLLGFVLLRKLVPAIIFGAKSQLFFIIWSVWWFAFLIVPIRGGLQHIPINQSDVYFSDNIFANHAAVNLPWNVMYSLSKRNYENQNPYEYFPDSTAQRLVSELYKTPKTTALPKVLHKQQPNVLFIILESYTAKVVGCLGAGELSATPNLDKLAQEGILFNNIYASGDRSEKGLVALLSSYPVQTTTSIVKTPRKTEHLPHLNHVLEAQGYRSRFYYGGELAFANIKSYLLNAGYDHLISKFDFEAKDYNSKWGVHDHVLLQRVLQDLKEEKQPFFTTVFTLSSHEPYDVPMPAKFKGADETTRFRNSVYYTDYALGQFVEAAKKEPWWQNTLVILAADHGHRFPGDDPNDAPSKFRIPFILTGGAIAMQNQVISKVGSQTDIVPTVLAQLNLHEANYQWSKNLLDPQTQDFAFYVFNDGFGYITPQGAVTFDNVAKKIIRKDAQVSPKQIDYGKAYMQLSFKDFLAK
ncbi:LTA synthase family protein [Adhaeribacter rhizoryzae]|uniref:Sulfatase-like hydrolase/transferase n=1 Tax=Adhaeribacter rhizoryzae TaxID=2607907 RepID=A0A5M6DP20_9BACT|nr:LTA synthase family protein [Adhaeribacter rhizoryzae]KAA5547920.1 sulfatase-like hydrolase/transferase [Adhaeribacter rhizoryzae]